MEQGKDDCLEKPELDIIWTNVSTVQSNLSLWEWAHNQKIDFKLCRYNQLWSWISFYVGKLFIDHGSCEFWQALCPPAIFVRSGLFQLTARFYFVVSGVCNGITTGTHSIGYSIKICHGGWHRSDARTGWDSSFTVVAEELRTELSYTCTGAPANCGPWCILFSHL